MYNPINFKTICSKLTALGNIIHSILIHKLMKPVSYLLLPKERKTQKKNKFKNKKSEKSVKANEKNDIFGRNICFFIHFFFSSNEILLFNNLTLKDQQKQTNTLKLRIF